MLIGDLLEWISGALLVGAAATIAGLPAALAVAGAFVFYLARVYALVPVGAEPDHDEADEDGEADG